MIPKDFTNLPTWRRAQLEKIVLARKVGAFLNESGHPPEEREVVASVAMKLAEDISMEVRQTLAFEIRRARDLPKELAERIARDVEDVSSPFLEQTEVFSPEDLARLARELREHARIAIARRSHVPSVVAVAIAEAGGERSVTFLLRNPGAEMRNASGIVIDRFHHHRAMMDLLARRPDFPVELVARIIDRVGEAARRELVERYGMPERAAEDATRFAEAESLVRWIAHATHGALNDYIRQKEALGALTDRLLSELTRRGGIRLMISYLVHLTGLDLEAVEKIVRHGRDEHIRKLLRRAGYRNGRCERFLLAVREGLERERNWLADEAVEPTAEAAEKKAADTASSHDAPPPHRPETPSDSAPDAENGSNGDDTRNAPTDPSGAPDSEHPRK